jgi:hypothetical protein
MFTVKIKDYLMKNTLLLIIFSVLTFLCSGCEEYLNIPPEASVTEEEVFGTYFNFQSYVDQIYNNICDPINFLTSSPNFGGETVSAAAVTVAFKAIRGNYNGFLSRSMFQTIEANGDIGLWIEAWKSIRVANVGLANLDHLVATDEEKRRIEGQLLFFRAYFHFEILSAWGSIPYINRVLNADEITLPRFYVYKEKNNYQACTEYIIEDLGKAEELLPLAWENPSTNLGRVTSLTALAYHARALLYAASPLMNEFSGNNAIPDKDYMRRAAEIAGKAIRIAEENPDIYGLVNWTDYQKMFATTTNNSMWTKETLFGRLGFKSRLNERGTGLFNNRLRAYIPDPNTYGGQGQFETLTQNYVDKFEMADGTLYKSEYDQDNIKRWDARDPRFRFNVYVDRDNPVDDTKSQFMLELFTGGKTRISGIGCLTPYVLHKFWPKGVTTKLSPNPPEMLNFRIMTPLMRLAEVYLTYAEAQYEYSENANSKAAGATLTALEAVNKVRLRARHVPTTAIGGSHGSFRTMILNERAVEFVSEAGQYWYDIRRWKIGHTLNNESIYSLDFDKNWTPSSFVRREVIKRVFNTRNYWLPFRLEQTQMYYDFPQNPGWE